MASSYLITPVGEMVVTEEPIETRPSTEMSGSKFCGNSNLVANRVWIAFLYCLVVRRLKEGEIEVSTIGSSPGGESEETSSDLHELNIMSADKKESI